MPKTFFSHVVGAARLPFVTLPSASSSGLHWENLASAYHDSFLACDLPVVPILRPEIYQTDVAHRSLGVAPGDWHLAVKPIDHIRPFHGIPNVFVSDWPFPSLSSQTGGLSPFFDQVRLLNQAAVVACCTEASATTLRGAGVVRAVHAPPFCPARTRPGTAPFRPAQEICTVMAAAEAHALLRLHLPLIQGFASAHAQDRRLRLVLAVSGAGGGSPIVLRDELLAAAAVQDPERTILVLPMPFSAALPEWQDRADLFLWGGVPFGLPLPLIDAALAGLPLIAPEAASASVGLPRDSFVPIPTRSCSVEPIDEPVAQVMPLWHDVPTAEGVRDAILAAAALGVESRASMARRVKREMERRFGLEAFRSGLRRLADYLPTGTHDGR